MVRGKTIVITGGGGFIGSSLGERLVHENSVTLIDLEFGRNALAFLDHGVRQKFRLVRANIVRDYEALASAMADADVVIHAAAVLGVRNVIRHPRLTLETNYSGTLNVVRAATASKCLSRFIFLSTSEIFGGSAFRVEENGATVLGSVQDARWCYSVSKVAAEHLLFSYHREEGVPVVVIRPFNIFGARRIGDHVIIRFIDRAMQNQDLIVHGDGSQIRSWCHIRDFVDAVVSCITSQQAVGETFNIGNPLNTLTIYDLAKRVVAVCDSSSRILFKAIDFSDIDIRVPTISKARDLLVFSPKVELEEGLRETVEWYRDNHEEISRCFMLEVSE